MSAEEVLSLLPTRIKHAGSIGYMAAVKIGIKTKSSNSYLTPLPATIACISLCIALAGRGVSISEIYESDDSQNYQILGLVPSSLLHWEGQFEALISQGHDGSETTLKLTFPGQIFAWGSGSKLLNQLKTESILISSVVKTSCSDL